MPKNKRPAGGRAARDFDPNRGAAAKAKRRPGQSSAGTRGSRSPGHRGYRPEAEDQPVRKRRWNADDRSHRDRATRAAEQHRPYAAGGRARGADRTRSDDRGYRERSPYNGRSYDDRPYNERPYSDRSYNDRPRHAGRPPYNDYDRHASSRDSFGGRPRHGRSVRGGDGHPRYGQNRGRYGSDSSRDGGGRARGAHDRPRYGDDRPRYDRDRSGFGDDRPQFDRDRVNRSGARPQDRADRPRYHVDGGSYAGERSWRRDDAARGRGRERDGRRAGGQSDRGRDRFVYGGERPRFRDDRTRGARPEADRAPHLVHEDVVHERLDAQEVQADAGAQASFADLGLGQNIVRTLAEMGAEHPFPIQAATIPAILAGRNVLGRGRTGSGKTIAFGAPLVEALLRERVDGRREYGRAPHALILAPTRELALQIDRTVQPIARCVGLFTTQIYGGVPQARQVGALKRGVDIVVGTPGRIEDLIAQGRLDLSHVRVAVLDEADLMSELGFLEPMQRLLRLVPDGAQKLMFSATLDDEVQVLVDEFLTDPAVFEVAGENQASGSIEHRVLMVDRRDKAEILASLVSRDGAKTLVFTRTRAYAEMLAEQFDDAGIRAVSLHGDLSQAKRTRSLQKLTSGRVDVLVATDVAARGIHVDDIDLVVQADAPDEYKTYLHRAGRTGRAGRSGTVVTLIPRQRRRRMTELLERAEIDAPFVDVRPGDDVLEELTGRQAAV